MEELFLLYQVANATACQGSFFMIYFSKSKFIIIFSVNSHNCIILNSNSIVNCQKIAPRIGTIRKNHIQNSLSFV